MHKLSKTRFFDGLQCAMKLYLSTYHRDLAQYSERGSAFFDVGMEVGLLATRLFPGGVRVEADYGQTALGLEKTKELASDDSVPAIFEAVLEHEGVLVRVDILERVSREQWRIVEVKAAASVKDQYIPDVAIQTHVANGAGLAVQSIHLMHINNQYVYDGDKLDLKQLFVREDITERAKAWQEQLPSLLTDQFAVLDGDMPDVAPGPHCFSPYGCPFWDHCTATKPRHWIYYLPRHKTVFNDLVARGVETIDRIPEDVPLTKLQRRARDCVRSGKPYVDPALKGAFRIGSYPIHYLDFETIYPAIPLFAGTRPYQQVPFQWSVQTVREEGAEPVGHAYLNEDSTDPRRELAERLLEALPEPGPIYVYNKRFEANVLRQLADHMPDLASGLLAIESRLVDLLPPIRSHYYHPDLNGSFSLKAVVPSLLPELDYSNLEIGEGQQAGLAYLRMITPDCPAEERRQIRQALLTYCGRDTLAMLKVHQALLGLCGA